MRQHFSISSEPVNADVIKAFIQEASTGATVIFEGIVRPDHMGDQEQVAIIEYEGLPEMAIKELEKISVQLQSQFDIQSIYLHHLLGKVAVGQTAVWVGISAKHRKDAFGALDVLMDEVKKTVPIFKKEIGQENSTKWVVPTLQNEKK
jgi:molybdopterin synthase catalytic subunit